ncbi:MAG: tripartite tricarboxylate transporter TctB family protein [Vitreoscilla sp.]|nr:tripartite tricarboxylate transporter TctB family protein [Vitreoscilla sp.]MBP6675163.1 tripartite tricarboxylate transporter TctB family protein [Vitreoscilla sp.]
MIKSQKDFWSGLLFILVGVSFTWGATHYRFGSSASPGPGYFPFGLGLLLALLGGVVLFKSLTLETDGGDKIGAFAWRPLLVILGAVVLFGLLVQRAGLVVALPALVLLSSLAGGEFGWKGALVAAVVLTVLSWAVFVLGLKLSIPMWPTVFGVGH